MAVRRRQPLKNSSQILLAWAGTFVRPLGSLFKPQGATQGTETEGLCAALKS